MSLSRLGNRGRPSDFTWPGFVDALASLLMVFVFVLMVFVIIQANLSFRISGQDSRITALQNELLELHLKKSSRSVTRNILLVT